MTGFNYQPQNGHSKLFLQLAENLGEFNLFSSSMLVLEPLKLMDIVTKTESWYYYDKYIHLNCLGPFMSNTQMHLMYEKSNPII